jgi:hypothetical protein
MFRTLSSTRCVVPTHEQLPSRRVKLAQLFTGLSTVLLATSSLLILCSSSVLAGVSATASAPPGSTGLQDLLNWTLYVGSIACAATAMYGFAKMGISHTQQSYQGANHGKAVALLGLVGALGLGLTPTIINGLTAIH